MNFGAKVISKIQRVAVEQLGQSFLSGLVAGNIQGNYILMYHGVTSDGNTLFNRRHISYKCFETQINFLKKHFAVITLNEFFEEKFKPGISNFAITFDDGYWNNYAYAKPILEKYKCPATFFVTGLNEVNDNILWGDLVNIATVFTDKDVTVDGEVFKKQNGVYRSADTGKSIYDIIRFEKAGYAYKLKVKEGFAQHLNFDNNPALREYWQIMADKQIQEVSKTGLISIGSHSYYHNNLGSLSLGEACDELRKSKKYLENLVQHEVDELAYPDGSYTLELNDSAYDMGFKLQLAADRYLFHQDDHELHMKKRYGIYAIDSCLNQVFTALKEHP